MSIEDLETTRGPSATALKVLERLGRRRAALEALAPAGDHQAAVLRRSFATLDDMEEALCEEGPGSPLLAEGWQRLDEIEARLAAPADVPAARPPGTLIRHRRRLPRLRGLRRRSARGRLSPWCHRHPNRRRSGVGAHGCAPAPAQRDDLM